MLLIIYNQLFSQFYPSVSIYLHKGYCIRVQIWLFVGQKKHQKSVRPNPHRGALLPQTMMRNPAAAVRVGKAAGESCGVREPTLPPLLFLRSLYLEVLPLVQIVILTLILFENKLQSN